MKETPQTTDLVAVRDLPIPQAYQPLVVSIREGMDTVDEAFRSICGQAVLTGLHLIFLKSCLNIAGPGRPTDDKGLSWKTLAPRITGRQYRVTRAYERIAEDIVEDEPSLAPLLEKPLHEHSEKDQRAFLETLRDRIDGHTISSLAVALGHARDAAGRGDNNPAGVNGADALPLTPEEKKQQLEFQALSAWFGTTDPEKIKPGSPAYALMRETGLQTDPDGKPAEATWPHLPRESVEQLAPALEKLAAEMKARLRDQR